MDAANSHYIRVLEDKGAGASASTLELYGILAEEMSELLEAAKSGDFNKVRKELLDISSAALFGVSSLNAWGYTGETKQSGSKT